MICELCGKQSEKGFKVRLEGSQVNACRNCARHGEVVEEVKQKPKPLKRQRTKTSGPGFDIGIQYDFVEDYGKKIKNAREKQGLKQDELAKRINEPASIIHRIESQRYEPSPEVMKKIQKRLGVRLLKHHSEDEDEKYEQAERKDLTLGDMIVVREKKK